MDARSPEKVLGENAEGPRPRRVWVTPTIEEADANEATAKTAANAETTFSKNGS